MGSIPTFGTMHKIPRIGVGVIVIKEDRILIGKRISSWGSGSWGPPGGHLEFNEKLVDAARREVYEETGLTVKNLKQIGKVTEQFYRSENAHYVTVFYIAEYKSGIVKIREPHRTKSWIWTKWEEMPIPLFQPLKHLVKTGYNPFK